jgi:hypothetical protein
MVAAFTTAAGGKTVTPALKKETVGLCVRRDAIGGYLSIVT